MTLFKGFIYFIYNTGVFLALVIYCLFITKKAIKRLVNKEEKNIVIYIFVSHLVFGFLYYLMSLVTTSDAKLYYNLASKSESWFSLFGTGTSFIEFLIYPFIKLGFSYTNLFFIFSIFGLKGFYNLYKLYLDFLPNKEHRPNWVAILLFLLPTFHFYTSGIGKDALIFYFLVIFFVSISRQKWLSKNYFILLIIFFIRPHICVFLLVSYFLVVFFQSKTKLIIKFCAPILAIGVLVFLQPIIKERLNIDYFSWDDIVSQLEKFQRYGKNKTWGNSIIDTEGAGVFFKMFAYSYLPLIWKANSVLKYIVSLENLFLLLTFVSFLFKSKKIAFFKSCNFYFKVMLVYSVLTWFLLGLTLYNLGLSTRQKYMYIPFLYMMIISLIGVKKKVLDNEKPKNSSVK